MTHQRTHGFLSVTVGAGGDETFVSRILEGRARQLIHLTGYRLAYTIHNQTPALSDAIQALVVLQAVETDWNLSGVLWLRRALKQPIIDFLFEHGELIAQTVGTWQHQQSEWITCDLLLPEIHLYSAIINGDDLDFHSWAVVEYEWVDANLADIAATNFNWGRDPQDFDRAG